MILRIKLDEGATKPCYAHKDDAGLDLFSRETKTVPANGSDVFDTGVHMEIPEGYCGMIFSKSGLNTNHSILSDGLVDCGFTGSIRIKLYNHGKEDYIVRKGDKISQIVIAPYEHCTLIESDSISGKERGDNGYGSTGR